MEPESKVGSEGKVGVADSRKGARQRPGSTKVLYSPRRWPYFGNPSGLDRLSKRVFRKDQNVADLEAKVI